MYLIDGNNVMGQRGRPADEWASNKATARRQLLNELAQLARVRKLRLTVVFDGAPDHHFPDASSYRGVKVLYAKAGSDADTRILELAEKERNKKSLTVITSDNGLTARLRVNGIRVLRVNEFRQWLDAAALASANQTADPNVPEDEMDDWFRYFGVDQADDEMDDEALWADEFD